CADVGAHHGVITRVLAELAGPTGAVVAFEAHPDNAAALRDRVEPGPYGHRVTVENKAVTDGSTDTVWLHPGRDHASTEWNIGGVDVEGREHDPELQVAATSLDQYFAKGRWPDFVKIDVEGAEGDVLRGMRTLLREARPALVIEFHNDEGWACRG